MSRSPAHAQVDAGAQVPLEGTGQAVQPHGLLLVVQGTQWRIVQASLSAATLLQRSLDGLLLATVQDLGGNLHLQLEQLPQEAASPGPLPLRCTLGTGAQAQAYEGTAERAAGGTWVLALEPLAGAGLPAAVAHSPAELLAQLGAAVRRFGEAASVTALAEVAAHSLQQLLGYAQVEVSTYQTDGSCRVVAAAPQRADADLALTWPARRAGPGAQAPLRLREVADIDAGSAALVPELPPGSGLSQGLRPGSLGGVTREEASALRQQGAVAALVLELCCDGQPWGRIACLHPAPRRLRLATRAAVELLAEAFGTRVLALENYARAQVLAEVRRLEQRLLAAATSEGDWHAALLRDDRLLLQPLAASGALLVHEGQTFGCGQVPTGAARQALLHWLQGLPADGTPGHADTLDDAHPARHAGVCGVLGVRLSLSANDGLLWLRPEQAGSGQCLPWTAGDLMVAAAFGAALSDLMLQVNAVRLLIAESQLERVRAAVAASQEAVVVTDGRQQTRYANPAFYRLLGLAPDALAGPWDLPSLFTDPLVARQIVGQVRAEQRSWHGEMCLRRADGAEVPVAVRAEPVPSSDRTLLGTLFFLEDISEIKRADAARERLDAALSHSGRRATDGSGRGLLGALLTNAGLAAMDIAEGGAPAAVPTLLEAVQASTARAAALLEHIRRLGEHSEQNQAPRHGTGSAGPSADGPLGG